MGSLGQYANVYVNHKMQLKFKELTSLGQNRVGGKNTDPMFRVPAPNLCSTPDWYSDFGPGTCLLPSSLISKMQ